MDRIFSSWLGRSIEEARALSESSDRVQFTVLAPQRFLARFDCVGLVRRPGGEVTEWGRFDVGISIGDQYLRRVNSLDVLTWIAPVDVWHPNVYRNACCIGPIAPGTSLVDLLYRTYELITYQSMTPDEFDALNLECCSWARSHQDLFPTDVRPLKRRSREREAQVGGTPR